MGFLDTLLGRSKPVRPDLDRLFALPSAAVTLQVGEGYVPTGAGSVCFASVEGGAFARLQRDVRELLDADAEDDAGMDPGAGPGAGGPPVEFSRDEYGYTWLLARQPADDLAALVNDLHAVNTLLEEGGFGPQLLCSMVTFRPDGAPEAGSGTASAGGAGAAGASERAAGGPLALVYLYKRGTFYPFAPSPGPGEKRDTALELRVRGLLSGDLPIEQDLSRWFPVWGAPGL